MEIRKTLTKLGLVGLLALGSCETLPISSIPNQQHNSIERNSEEYQEGIITNTTTINDKTRHEYSLDIKTPSKTYHLTVLQESFPRRTIKELSDAIQIQFQEEQLENLKI